MSDAHAPKNNDSHSRRDKPNVDEEQAAPGVESGLAPALVSFVQMQRLVGNSGVKRLLNEGRLQPRAQSGFLANVQPGPAVQRDTDAGAASDAASTTNPELERILRTNYESIGGRFDLEYDPTGGNAPEQRPIAGTARVTLKLHVTFRDFTRAIRRQAPYNTMRFTREQRRDFRWKPDEKEEFKRNLRPSIQNAWKEKHLLECNTPGLEELNATVDVVVQLVESAEDAHTRVTAQKVPEGAPRFRSYVQGDEAVLDRLDPTEARTFDVDEQHWTIEPFDNDSADITPVQGQLDAFIREFDTLEPHGSEEDERLFGEQYTLRMVGRATTPGSKRYNKRLATQRANAVGDYIFLNSARSSYTTTAVGEGETGTTEDEEFRRVDLYLTREDAATQNTAAHEAGHMFGLGDEYEDEEDDDDPSGRGRFTGDRPSHYEDVVDELGTDAADDVMVSNNESIMSVGGEVAPAHYTPFIQKLEGLTGLQWAIRS